IWSCPSFNELARDGQDVDRHDRLNPTAEPRKAYVTGLLQGRPGPAIAATNYVRADPEQIRAFVPRRHTVPGTDGYGRSDTRENLRRHFEVSRNYIAQAAVAALAAEGKLTARDVAKANEKYGIDAGKPYPLHA